MTTLKSVNEGLNLLKKHYDKQLKIAEESGDEKDVLWVKMKYEHSLDVFKISEFLIENDEVLSKLEEQYKIYGKLGAILHDIGRAYKIGKNKEKVEPHGAFGADNILKDIEGIDNPFILIPIKYHDVLFAEKEAREELETYSLSNKENEIIILLLKLVMDSDKLANFELFKTLQKSYFLHSPDELYFSKNCLESFKNRQLLKRDDRETIFDQILFYAAWVYGLNFEASRKFALEHKSMNGFINMMKKNLERIRQNNHNNIEDIQKVEFIIQKIQDQLITDNLMAID